MVLVLLLVILFMIGDGIFIWWYLKGLEERLDNQKKIRDIQIEIQNQKIGEVWKYINKL
ncbi:hypothetical protein P4313_13430 [Bacillus tropicus]|uniref:hypothetical protein n=1 Tax=Bacillus tropicus TaxID=2026188 RepID=UPI0026BEDF21|nr:hypothetical protein [Bacillus tropicus]